MVGDDRGLSPARMIMTMSRWRRQQQSQEMQPTTVIHDHQERGWGHKNIKPKLVHIITIILPLLPHSRLCVGMETWNCHSYRGQRESLAWLANAPLQRVHTSNCGRPGTRCGRLYLPNCDDRSKRNHTSRRDSGFVYPYLNATRTRPRPQNHRLLLCLRCNPTTFASLKLSELYQTHVLLVLVVRKERTDGSCRREIEEQVERQSRS